MSEYELYHHGVKGQKWGVRKDRTAQESRYTRNVKSGKDFKVSKGSSIYRATNSKSEKFNGRAYATLKRDDANGYATTDVLGQPFDYIDVYKPKESLNVAGYRTAARELDKTYKLNVGKITPDMKMLDVQDKFLTDDGSSADVFMKGPDNYSPYKKALIKKGYDAVVDLCDMGEFSDTPIILLDDKKIKRGKQFATQSPIWEEYVWG